MKQNKNAEIHFFNRFGDHKEYDVFDRRGYKRIVDEFYRYIEPLKKITGTVKVLDFGCGTGAFTSQLIPYGFELYGIDISPNCIESAKKRYPQIIFETGDIERTRFDGESFDVIILSGVLHHFPDFSSVLKECHRVLKKGGIILAYDPHKSNPFMRLYRCKDSPLYSSKGVTDNEAPLSRKVLEHAVRSAGFSEVSVYGISGVTYAYVESRFAFILLPVYNFIETIMDFEPLRKRFGSFVITYAKK